MFERLLAKRHIGQLDLDSIRLKVIEKYGWSSEKTSEVELGYRRFLYALAENRTGLSISPPAVEVDEFWHEHILNTPKYREDCDRIFGRYMDHTPGLSSEDQASADARRRKVYEENHIDSVYFYSGGGESFSSGCGGGGNEHSHGDGGHSAGGHGTAGSDGVSGDGGDSGGGGASGGDGGGGDGGGG